MSTKGLLSRTGLRAATIVAVLTCSPVSLVVPSFGVGIGKIGMISGGFSAIPGIDLEDQVFYIAPKLQLFSSEYVQGWNAGLCHGCIGRLIRAAGHHQDHRTYFGQAKANSYGP